MQDLSFISNMSDEDAYLFKRCVRRLLDTTFLVKDKEEKLRIYTTRPDTLFGVTYMVVSPEHPYLDKYKDEIKNWDEIVAYREMAARKSDFERTELAKDKTGVAIDGLSAINPVNGEEIPICIRLCIDELRNRSDYGGTGT